MMDWFSKELSKGTRIIPSENGFTSDKIAKTFLQHYIDHSDSGPEADWKIMLMDNHDSHALANINHTRPYSLIPHLTHCMQPLDVGVFHPYKHWHDMTIQDALLQFNVEHTLQRFLADLTKIRDNTFKKCTIRSAFEKSGTWPVNAKNCISLLKTFKPPDAQEKLHNKEKETTLSILPHIRPTSSMDVEIGLQTWQKKLQQEMLWSDPARSEQFESFVNDTKTVVHKLRLVIFNYLYIRKEEKMT